MNTQNVQQKIARARLNMLLDDNLCFFSSILCNLPMVETESIPTFATDGRYIYYSPKFTESLEVPVIKTIILHELLHSILLHPFRKQNRDHKKFNVACDYALNLIIEEMN